MGDSRWGRFGAVCAIAFAVLFFFGVMLPELPGAGESEATVLEFYEDSGNRLIVMISAYLIALAGLAFLGFLGSLYRGLRAAEGESGSLATIALAGGIVFVAMIYSGTSAWANVPGGIEFGGEAVPGYEIPIWFTQLGYGNILLYGMMGAIATIIPTSILARRTGVLPQWLAITGFVCAVLLLFGAIFVPVAALPIWALATGIAMLKNPATQPERTTRPATTAV